MARQHVTIPDGEFPLEAAWHRPDGSGPFPAVIVCHPHPLYGGDMSNNIVFRLCQALAERSIAALRFNFRGVGRSGGSYGGGTGEQADLRAALAHVRSAPDIDDRIGLAGYSFGASVAVPVAAGDGGVRLLALVSPALSDTGWEQLKGYGKPRLVIAGDSDFVIPEPDLRRHCQDMAGAGQYQVIAGADHFWAGFEAEVAERVSRFVTEVFRDHNT